VHTFPDCSSLPFTPVIIVMACKCGPALRSSGGTHMRDDVLEHRDAPQAHGDPDALEHSCALKDRDAPGDSDAPEDPDAFEDGGRFPHTCTYFAGGGGGGGGKGSLHTQLSSLKAIGLGLPQCISMCLCTCVRTSLVSPRLTVPPNPLPSPLSLLLPPPPPPCVLRLWVYLHTRACMGVWV
jgi:hypothetical protein